jgi:hypothetical protein
VSCIGVVVGPGAESELGGAGRVWRFGLRASRRTYIRKNRMSRYTPHRHFPSIEPYVQRRLSSTPERERESSTTVCECAFQRSTMTFGSGGMCVVQYTMRHSTYDTRHGPQHGTRFTPNARTRDCNTVYILGSSVFTLRMTLRAHTVRISSKRPSQLPDLFIFSPSLDR